MTYHILHLITPNCSLYTEKGLLFCRFEDGSENKISIDDVIVIHDDVDLPVGYIRIRENGASGGHNGIKSIIQCLGSESFKRIRVGIDKGEDMIKHVLTKFKGVEVDLIDEACVKVAKALRDYLTMPFNKMMSLNNVRKK